MLVFSNFIRIILILYMTFFIHAILGNDCVNGIVRQEYINNLTCLENVIRDWYMDETLIKLSNFPDLNCWTRKKKDCILSDILTIMENNELIPTSRIDDMDELIEAGITVVNIVSTLVGLSEDSYLFDDDMSSSFVSEFPNDLHFADIYSPPKTTEFVQLSIRKHDDQHRLSLNTTNRRYRIHLGTRPGFYTSKLFPYEQSQWRHEQLIDLLQKNFQFHILLKNGFSTTEAWGLEPYASIIFNSCTYVRVEGMAAIIGHMFRQDGIGIFDEQDDYQEYPIGTTSDNFDIHRLFTISRLNGSNDSFIPSDDAKTMMIMIQKKYPCLSGQFGRTNETIELHDFGNHYHTLTIDHLQDMINKIFIERKSFYQIEERKAKSKLLLKNEYEQAIKRAEFQFLAAVIEAVRLHDTLYNCN